MPRLRMGTLILEHHCKKWRPGMKKPKIVSDKSDWGYMKCSLCGKKVGATLNNHLPVC